MKNIPKLYPQDGYVDYDEKTGKPIRLWGTRDPNPDNKPEHITGQLPANYFLGENYKNHEYYPLLRAHGNCTNPTIGARPIKGSKMRPSAACRKCHACSRKKQWEWQNRIECEHNESIRSWFVTLTFRDDRLEQLAPETKTPQQRTAALYTEVQKHIRHIRKVYKVKFKYLVVFEIGNGKTNSKTHRSTRKGHPHFHMIISEKPDKPLLHKHIHDNWHKQNGITDIRLIKPENDQDTIKYVAKYIGKNTNIEEYENYALMRIQRSNPYGKNWKQTQQTKYKHKTITKLANTLTAIVNTLAQLDATHTHKHPNQNTQQQHIDCPF